MAKNVWGVPFEKFVGFLLSPDPPVTPLVEGLIVKEGTYGMLFGEASSAKSLVAQALIVALASGRKFAGHFQVNGGARRVMFLDLDQGENTTMRRFAKLTNWAEWDEDDKEMLGDRIFLYSPVIPGRLVGLPEQQEQRIEATRDTEALWAQLSENQIDVLVIDCLVATLGGLEENHSNVAREYFATVKWLQAKSLQEGRPLTVLILHHSRKQAIQSGGGKLPAQDDMRGSGAWRDSLDFQIKAWKKLDVVGLVKLKERNSEFPEWKATFRLVDRDDGEGGGIGVKLQYEPDAELKNQGDLLWSELSLLTEGNKDRGVNLTQLAATIKENKIKGLPHSRLGLRPILYALCDARRVQCSNQDYRATDPTKVFWNV